MNPEMSPQLRDSLQKAGYPVKYIQQDIASGLRDPKKTVRNWTCLPNSKITLFNADRDIYSPVINQAFLAILAPWIEQKIDEFLPSISIKQLARATKLPPERVTSILTAYPLSFSVNGASFTTKVQRPDLPKRKLRLTESRAFNVSPKRVLKDARYQSRRPGGGQVQKVRAKKENIDGVLRKKAWDAVRIQFLQSPLEPFID